MKILFTQPMVFLALLLIIGLLAKNQSLMIAVGFLIILKFFGNSAHIFQMIGDKGINWGVTIITIAVLAPIASGKIGFTELTNAVKSVYAWIALGAGIAVALIAKKGLILLTDDPHITAALVIGTILAVALFNGVAVGPLIGAGIAYMAMKIFEWFT